MPSMPFFSTGPDSVCFSSLKVHAPPSPSPKRKSILSWNWHVLNVRKHSILLCEIFRSQSVYQAREEQIKKFPFSLNKNLFFIFLENLRKRFAFCFFPKNKWIAVIAVCHQRFRHKRGHWVTWHCIVPTAFSAVINTIGFLVLNCLSSFFFVYLGTTIAVHSC